MPLWATEVRAQEDVRGSVCLNGWNLCSAELEPCLKVCAAPLQLACRGFPMSFVPLAAILHVVKLELLLQNCAAAGSLQV